MPLDSEHHAHVDRILRRLTIDIMAKYSAGQEEHGGELWRKPGMLEQAYAEALDLVVYLATALEQRERHGRLL